MFNGDADALRQLGDKKFRSLNFQLAAYIWLFAANPNIKWTHLVGADIPFDSPLWGWNFVTFGTGDIKADVVYFPRPGVTREKFGTGKGAKQKLSEEDADKVDKLWEEAIYKVNTKHYLNVSSGPVRIGIAKGDALVNGKPIHEMIPEKVYEFIKKTPELMELYKKEVFEINLSMRGKGAGALEKNNRDMSMITRKGGIDFDTNTLPLDVKGDGVDFNTEAFTSGLPCLDEEQDGTCARFDFESLESISITGFTPVIFQIVPMPAVELQMFLGVQAGGQEVVNYLSFRSFYGVIRLTSLI